MDHLSSLNAPQKEAVEATEGPLLVLAGAGSGKTRVITHRIVHLIEKGVAPRNILAVTFTNKAAKEMRERVEALLREESAASRAGMDGLPTVSTFHSLGVILLREHAELLGMRKRFVIYDRGDSVKAIRKALEKRGYSPKQFEPRKVLSIISRAKGEGLSQQAYLESKRSYVEGVAGEVWAEYDRTLREDGAFDFDDLLLKTVELFWKHETVLRMYQERFQYLHVDEYQDTNKVQFDMVRLLAGEHQNICVVGDLDQNIYSWRGADTRNILQFERHFKDAKIIMLEENYRSTQTIVEASNKIIEKNVNRPEKTVFTNNAVGDKISLYVALSGRDEAEHIALAAKELVADGAAPSEIAVLYRTNFQSRVLEEAFLTYEVPYQLLGVRFFERKEVKEALSYARISLGGSATSDLTRVINTPPRGIGKVTLLKLVEGNRATLGAAAEKKVSVFDSLVEDLRTGVPKKKPSEIIKFIIKRTGLTEYYKKQGEEGEERILNLQELVTLASRYDEYEGEEGLQLLLDDASLQSDQDELKKKEDRDAVRLMTVHSAKGLEFPYVFIAGLEEGLFPHERLSDDHIDEEEERRLFYVALTRAGKRVFLSFAHTRVIFGSERINVPSSFIDDFDPEHLDIPQKESSGFERVIDIE